MKQVVKATCADKVWRPWCFILLIFSCFTSLVRMDYNIALSLLGFFFVNRPPNELLAFNPVHLARFFWISLISLPIDLTWVIVMHDATNELNKGPLAHLKGTWTFCWVLSLIYFILKLPFVLFLFAFKRRNELATSLQSYAPNLPQSGPSDYNPPIVTQGIPQLDPYQYGNQFPESSSHSGMGYNDRNINTGMGYNDRNINTGINMNDGNTGTGYVSNQKFDQLIPSDFSPVNTSTSTSGGILEHTPQPSSNLLGPTHKTRADSILFDENPAAATFSDDFQY